MQDFAAILRQAIETSGQTQTALAKASGVPQSRISVFLSGGDLRLGHVSRLAAALRLELRRVKANARDA